MKENIMREQELFDIVRKEPTEISIEKVNKMVSGFPLTPAPFDWSSIINLNTIIMSSITAFILAGSFMLYSGESDGESLQTNSYQLVPETEIVQEQVGPDGQRLDQEQKETAPQEDPKEPIPPKDTEEPTPAEDVTEASPIVPAVAPEGPIGPEGEEEFAEAELPELPETPDLEGVEELKAEAEVLKAQVEEEVLMAQIEAMELEFEAMIPQIHVRHIADPSASPTPHAMEDGKKTFDVGSFNSVGLSGSMHVYITQGNEHSVWAEGDEDELEKIEVVEKNGHIKIKTKSKKDNGKHCYDKANVTVHVTMPTFESLHVSGSGSMDVGDFDNLKDIDLHIAGSGEIKAEGNLKISGRSEFHIAGSGDMNIDGTASEVEVHIAGSGDFKGADLRAERVEVHIAGSGDVQVHAEKELDVSIAGSGDVRYEGNPSISKSVVGSGDINPMN
ncbi:MAG: DUF4097 family beta strand repeat protein [Flavobacteriales bacterium]|nr:DUF4097 family beta strand repeat protein [Flavobacteriales bacterium]